MKKWNEFERTAKATAGNAVKLDVVFANNQFSVPINFGRLYSGDAKGGPPWRHPFAKRVAIRTLRTPAQISASAQPPEEAE